MPAGEAFTTGQAEQIERAVRLADREGPLAVSVYVGELGGRPRARAESLHAGLPRASEAALVAVDPGGRRLEVVTGSGLAHRLDDRACGLAAMSMTSAFAAGDLSGGIATGVRMLAEHARTPRSLHTDQIL